MTDGVDKTLYRTLERQQGQQGPDYCGFVRELYGNGAIEATCNSHGEEATVLSRVETVHGPLLLQQEGVDDGSRLQAIHGNSEHGDG